MILLIVDWNLLCKFQKISDNRVKFLQYINDNSMDIKLVTNSEIGQNRNIGIVDLCKKLQLNDVDTIIHYVMGPGACPVDNQIMIDLSKNSNVNGTIVKKVLWIEDFQHIDCYCNIIPKFNCIMLSIQHGGFVKQYQSLYPKINIKCFNHYIDNEIFKDYHLPKVWDILFYGYVDRQYPFRMRLFNLLQKWQKIFHIKFIKHPGYHQLDGKNSVVGEQLARLINQSYLTVCTRSKNDMLVKKYLETCFCKSTILGDLPSDYANEFRENCVEIDNKMNDFEILKKIINALKNREKLIKISEKYCKIISNKYNFNMGVEKIKNILK